MKRFKLPFAAIIALSALFMVWPQHQSPAQQPDSSHISPDILKPREEKVTEKLVDQNKIVTQEIERIKNSKPKVVVKNHVRTVYKEVPKVIFIDTCLPRMPENTYVEEPTDTIPYVAPAQKKQSFLNRIFKNIFHKTNKPN